MANDYHRMRVIDSHTCGEPTRIIVEGGPDLGTGPLRQRRDLFRDRYDAIRCAVVNEPRGSDVLVGGLLCPPHDPDCVAGVIFFNNAGFLNMCGHGTMGVAVTLAHLGRISAGTHRLETPVGVVEFTYDGRHQVTIRNVPSFRLHHDVSVTVPDVGPVRGDVAWGGNWFFLVPEPGEEIAPSNLERLLFVTRRIYRTLREHGITGVDGAIIDHIELFGPPQLAGADSKNFVLCPGMEYDRSPCGTGTSAKIACLLADGKLQPGQIWRQESIIGSLFEAWGTVEGDRIIPHIRGTAYVTAESTLLLDPDDPYRHGIRLAEPGAHR